MNLRELTADQEAILAQVENGDFTLDDVSDHLDMLEEDRNKKIENYLHVINRLTSEEVTVTAELDRLQTIRQQKEKALSNIKNWLLISMKDGEKHDFDLFKVSRVKGREVVTVTDINKIPQIYITERTSVSVDKRKLLDYLKGVKEKGLGIEGAEIATGNPRLRIK
tara:strand:- start:72 stop:569 length:498 start_codon:yes stop_codon:yes gene_type:complete